MAHRNGLTARFGLEEVRLALGVTIVGLLAGGGSALMILHQQVALAAVLPIAAALPIVVRLAQRKFDPFEPIALLALTFFILYGIRPAAELASGFKYFANQYTRSGFSAACLVSLVGMLSLYAGYAVRTGARGGPAGAGASGPLGPPDGRSGSGSGCWWPVGC